MLIEGACWAVGALGIALFSTVVLKSRNWKDELKTNPEIESFSRSILAIDQGTLPSSKHLAAPWGTPISPESQIIRSAPGSLAGFVASTNGPLWVSIHPESGKPADARVTVDPEIGFPPVIQEAGFAHTALSPYLNTTSAALLLTPEVADAMHTWIDQQASQFTCLYLGPIFADNIQLIQNVAVPSAVYGVALRETQEGKLQASCVVIHPNQPGLKAKAVVVPILEIIQMTGIDFVPLRE